jgi:hypothetical protein
MRELLWLSNLATIYRKYNLKNYKWEAKDMKECKWFCKITTQKTKKDILLLVTIKMATAVLLNMSIHLQWLPANHSEPRKAVIEWVPPCQRLDVVVWWCWRQLSFIVIHLSHQLQSLPASTNVTFPLLNEIIWKSAYILVHQQIDEDRLYYLI